VSYWNPSPYFVRPSIRKLFLSTTSSQKLLGQLQPNLVGSISGGMAIQICSNGGAWGPQKAAKRGNFRYILKNLLLPNHKYQSFNILHTSGVYSDLFK